MERMQRYMSDVHDIQFANKKPDIDCFIHNCTMYISDKQVIMRRASMFFSIETMSINQVQSAGSIPAKGSKKNNIFCYIYWIKIVCFFEFVLRKYLF